MVGGAFIDLLSSDEEAESSLPMSKTAPKPATKPTIDRPAGLPKDDYFYQFDELDSTVRLDDSCAVHPTKKRKLHPLSRAKSTYTKSTEAHLASIAWNAAKCTAGRMDDMLEGLDNDDPILFTSSDHCSAVAATLQTKAGNGTDLDMLSEGSDCSLPEDVLASPNRPTRKPKQLYSKATSFLSDVENYESSQKFLSPERSRRKPRETHKRSAMVKNAKRSLETEISSSDKVPTAPDFVNGSSMLSNKTRAVLASLSAQPGSLRRDFETSAKASGNHVPMKLTLGSAPRARSATDSGEEETGEIKSNKQAKKSRLTEEEKAQRRQEKERAKEAKARERHQAREQKAKEKENDLIRKRAGKEEKAKQKQRDAEIAEVNKAKLDKKLSTPEMIVDLPASIHGQSVDTQTREFLKTLDVEASLYQSTISDVVKWRRKVKAKWSADEGHWEPLPRMQIEDEKHVMCIMPATEFVALSTAQDDKENIETHISKLKSAYPDCVPIYLIEGLAKKLRESKTAANRQYQNDVLHQGQIASTSRSHTNKRGKPTPTIVDEDLIEDTLLRMQVLHNCLIHHTAFHVETAEWIATFTQHISTIPYK